MNLPRVLVISHTVFSTGNNMGRSLATLLSGWDPESLSQLYFYPEAPQLPLCRRYFRITDGETLRALWTRLPGGSPMAPGHTSPSSRLRPLYRLGHNCRSALPGLLRDALWALAPWYSQALATWMAEVRPEVLLFAPGESVFSHRVAFRLAKDYGLPVVAICYDGIYTPPGGSLLRQLQYRLRLSWARRLLAGSACLLTACRSMSEAYAPLFSIPCRELYTPHQPSPQIHAAPEGIRYFGNLGLGRWRQLVAIGRALRALALPGFPVVEVYSQEENPHILSHLTKENGLRFCGSIPGSHVTERIAASFLVIHTESFAPRDVRQVSLSLSTKLADSLAFAPCILAYGPASAASIRYLLEKDAACVATSEASLPQTLLEALTQKSRRANCRDNARRLAAQNHSPQSSGALLTAILAEAAGASGRRPL